LALAPASAQDGFRWTPDMGWSSGDHRLDLDFVSRYRLESWSAFRSQWDTFHGFRSRLTATYAWEDRCGSWCRGSTAPC